MPERIPQSTAIRVAFKAYLASDHVSAATGKTIAVVISKNGAAFANPNAGATNATAIASGWYYVDLDTTDTGTAGPLIVRGTEGTIDDAEVYFRVVAATNGGFTALPNAAAEAAGGLYTRGTGAGQINQPANGMIDGNVVRWNGTAVATPDTAGYPKITIKSGTGTGELALSSGVADADVKKVNAVADSADRLEKHISVIGTFTVDAGASTTSVPLSAVSPSIGVADQYKGRIIVFDNATTTANLRGAVARISAHTAGAGVGTLTVTPALPATPASGDEGMIV